MLTETDFSRLGPIMDFMMYINFISLFVMGHFTTIDEIPNWIPKIISKAKENDMNLSEMNRKILDFLRGTACKETRDFFFLLLKETTKLKDNLDTKKSKWMDFDPADERMLQSELWKITKENAIKKTSVGNRWILNDDEKKAIVEVWRDKLLARRMKEATDENKEKIKYEEEEIRKRNEKQEEDFIKKVLKDKNVKKWECGCYVKHLLVDAVSNYKPETPEDSRMLTGLLKQHSSIKLYEQLKAYKTIPNTTVYNLSSVVKKTQEETRIIQKKQDDMFDQRRKDLKAAIDIPAIQYEDTRDERVKEREKRLEEALAEERKEREKREEDERLKKAEKVRAWYKEIENRTSDEEREEMTREDSKSEESDSETEDFRTHSVTWEEARKKITKLRERAIQRRKDRDELTFEDKYGISWSDGNDFESD
jgi:hypothetical protein